LIAIRDWKLKPLDYTRAVYQKQIGARAGVRSTKSKIALSFAQ